MIRYERRHQVFALCLAALAGFVDATGFILTQGLFVSFMTGNSTRLAVGTAAGSPVMLAAASLIGAFLLGVIAGSLIASAGRARRKPAVLAFVTAMLAGAAMLHSLGVAVLPVGLMAVGMGALNNVFVRDGEVSIGITYMTGNLVRLGQRLAASIRGDRSAAWLPHLMLWASLMIGAIAGALAASAGVACLWLATTLAAMLTLSAGLLDTSSRNAQSDV